MSEIAVIDNILLLADKARVEAGGKSERTAELPEGLALSCGKIELIGGAGVV